MAQDIDTIADLLLSGDARSAAKNTLAFLLEQNRARSVSLWSLREGQLRLALSVALDQEAIANAQAAWSEHRRTLEAGQPWEAPGRLVVPIETEEGRHLIALDGLQSKVSNVDSVARFARVALKALLRGGAGHAARSAEDVRREELIALLVHEEWNIARVARRRGVTRKTIYDWMGRFRIQREKPARS
jgi:transcriptional regulator of acetoin/glycerol metabolism